MSAEIITFAPSSSRVVLLIPVREWVAGAHRVALGGDQDGVLKACDVATAKVVAEFKP